MASQKILVLALLLLTLACNKDENLIICIDSTVHATWQLEEFKPDLNIQFPSNYEGLGRLVHFEGEYFEKFRDNREVVFFSNYCDSGVYCEAYGPEFSAPVTAVAQNGDTVSLSTVQEFCSNNVVVGQFYHNNEPNATGKFFYEVEGELLAVAAVYYPEMAYQEVLEVLKTIREN